ncbi:MAG: hypothetical protein HY304_03800 [candidate division Zixibacteria bacterium]|nr:hypothetical protein [candidate division Zixibacteria bacterium]
MTDTAAKRSDSVNTGLVLLLSLLIGLVGGYLYSRRGPITATTITTSMPDPHALTPFDEYIIANFTCPAPICQDQLLECHCDMANQIKDHVKQELGEGKNGNEIRAELETQYGAQLHKGS